MWTIEDYEDNKYVINYGQLIMRMVTQRLNDILDDRL